MTSLREATRGISSFHVIKATAAIPKPMHNDKHLQVLFAGGSRIWPTNPTWRTVAILKTIKCNISATFDYFDEIWYADSNWLSQTDQLLKFEILKIQDGGHENHFTTIS